LSSAANGDRGQQHAHAAVVALSASSRVAAVSSKDEFKAEASVGARPVVLSTSDSRGGLGMAEGFARLEVTVAIEAKQFPQAHTHTTT
jgi:hypothetical protein